MAVDLKEFLNKFQGKREDEVEEDISTETSQAETEETIEEDQSRQESTFTGGRFGVSGVGSYINVDTRRRREEQQDTITDNETEEVIDTNIIEDNTVEQKLLSEGYIDGEIVDINELEEGKVRGLLVEGADDFIEGDFEEIIEETQPEAILVQPEIEEEIPEAQLESQQMFVGGEDTFKLAEAFTDIEFEDDEDFADDLEILNNDFVGNNPEFVANSFEDQGVLAPFYPSEDLAFAGFSDPKDLAIEADFSFGGID